MKNWFLHLFLTGSVPATRPELVSDQENTVASRFVRLHRPNYFFRLQIPHYHRAIFAAAEHCRRRNAELIDALLVHRFQRLLHRKRYRIVSEKQIKTKTIISVSFLHNDWAIDSSAPNLVLLLHRNHREQQLAFNNSLFKTITKTKLKETK